MTSRLETPGASRDAAPARGAWAARWRVAARLARRQVRRTLPSSLLIGALMMLPIATMTAYTVVAASTIATPAEQVATELGRTQAWIGVRGLPGNGLWQAPTQPEFFGYPATMREGPEGERVEDPTTLLPDDVESIEVVEANVRVATPDGVTSIQAWTGYTWDPRFAGRFDVIDGRSPTGPDEMMATPAALGRLGLRIGDTVELADPARSLTVTGTMSAAVLPSDVPALFLPASVEVRGEPKWYLPEHELSWEEVEELNEHGVVAFSRAVALDPPDMSGTDAEGARVDYWSSRWPIFIMLGAASLFSAYVVVMLAGAAFAVSARRQQRALAVAASVGASASDLRRIVLLQGTTLGIAAGAVGAVVGIGAGAAVLAVVDNGSTAQFPGLHLPWEMVLAIVALAVLVGTASAAVPAHTVARSDVLSALRGARRPQRARPSHPIWGSVLVVVGLAVTIAAAVALTVIDPSIAWDSPLRTAPPYGVIIGPIVVQLGVVLSGRWLLWTTARLFSRIGLSARLASRDAAANASRSVPAFGAIGATVFIGVFALSGVAMQNGQSARNWYYQAPVGSMAVTYVPTGTGGEYTPLSEHEIDEAGAAALDLAAASGSRRIAVVERQPEPWLADADDMPSASVRALALLPDEYLIDSDRSFMTGSQDPSDPISVIDADEIETALGVRLTSAQLAAYRDGAAISADPRFVTEQTLEISAWTWAQAVDGALPSNIWRESPAMPAWEPPLWTERLPAISLDLPLQPVLVAISPQTADRLGITTAPRLVIAGFDTAVPLDMRDRLGAQAETLSTSSWTLTAGWEDGPPDDTLWMAPIIAAVATLVLGASAVALSLARFERRPDDATVSAVGGSDGLRRRIGFWQGLIIAGFGTLTGAVAGILPPLGIAMQSGGMLLASDIPWTVLVALAVALPLAIAVVSWLVTPRRPELTRRTVIT
ncbi:MAG: FtsX-like permease family protein [Microbacterium sp.]|uniref:FtsX-like permease family protein n=1 Tax=Microbacterium sp. TaxID=51671 RepID=UPI001D493187|nr:FtsX-like permease family protein [Microbacterium sp.]MBW8761659.1 FtsX-like permease family protein [Microbacterium sp.]